jgi:hypothetical protein
MIEIRELPYLEQQVERQTSSVQTHTICRVLTRTSFNQHRRHLTTRQTPRRGCGPRLARFQSGSERRRFYRPPDDGEHFNDAQLSLLLHHAVPHTTTST